MNKPQLTAEIKEEEIYMPEQLPENNKPDDKPVKSALHGKIREQFYKDFYVCVPRANHYPESCICEFTDEEIEPVIEWFVDFLATALEEQRATFVDEVKNRKATIKWLWGKQKTDDECFLMVMEQVQKIADILNGKE